MRATSRVSVPGRKPDWNRSNAYVSFRNLWSCSAAVLSITWPRNKRDWAVIRSVGSRVGFFKSSTTTASISSYIIWCCKIWVPPQMSKCGDQHVVGRSKVVPNGLTPSSTCNSFSAENIHEYKWYMIRHCLCNLYPSFLQDMQCASRYRFNEKSQSVHKDDGRTCK